MKGLLFTYALTYGGAVVSLFNPFYGLLIYICFAIIKPPDLWWWSVPLGNYSRIVAIALLIGWVLHGFGDWRFGRAKTVVWALVGFWIWSVLSTLQALDPAPAMAYLDTLTKICLPFLVGVTTIDSTEKLKQLVVVIVFSVGIVAFNENQNYLAWGPKVGDNITAHTMAIGAPVAYFAGTLLQNRVAKLCAFLAAGLCVHTVMIHMSRGGMLGLAITAVLGFWVIKKNTANVALFALAAVLALAMAGPSVKEEFSTVFSAKEQRDTSAQSRLYLWADMWHATQQKPILGFGPRCWPLIAPQYGWSLGREGHGTWQQLAVETGLPGAVLFFAFYTTCVWGLWPAAFGKSDTEIPWLRPYAQIVVVALPAWMVEQCLASFYLAELPYYITLIGAGALRLSSTAQQRNDQSVDTSTHDLPVRGIAIV